MASNKAQGGRIECYVDIASFFSYIAVLQLISIEDTLKHHGVEVEIYPVLIGGMMGGSGNKPPWTVPTKAAYLSLHDTRRAKLLVGLDPDKVQGPKDMFAAARTAPANRALTYISREFPRPVYWAALRGLCAKFWTVTPGTEGRPDEDQRARDLTTPDRVAAALGELQQDGSDGKGKGKPLFTPDQVARIMAASRTDEYKTLLKKQTDEALARGAFGAPWFWVTPSAAEEKGEPVFGSDRWHVIFDILGLPYTRLALLGGTADPIKSML
ncbi:glutathione S-transferase kappa 1 [Microdochium nivale]|nr:glutathione S-transferase kappa 1 [Microdochium nivale]